MGNNLRFRNGYRSPLPDQKRLPIGEPWLFEALQLLAIHIAVFAVIWFFA